MNTFHLSIALLLLSTCVLSAADEPAIDVARGRQLMERFKAGETLSAEDHAYLERVRQAIRARTMNKLPKGSAAPVSTVNPDDWKMLVPITDMTESYKGEDGGLYGGGKNEPPEGHLGAHLRETAKIVPRDASGEPSAEGKIGFITLGFSNPSNAPPTTMRRRIRKW